MKFDSMRIPPFLSGLLILTIGWCQAQVCGCTDSLATNYNADATVNDGSCQYASTVIHATLVGQLDSVLDGTSTLLYWRNGYWTYNDHNDHCLYLIDSTDATIENKWCFPGIYTYDAEEVSQDSLYLYVGDIGNNHGCRQDLHILRIRKLTQSPQIFRVDTIAFSYEDQTDFTVLPTNSTDFDCEAFVVTDDSIYLFTKQWITMQTAIYSLPKTPGTHVARRRGVINTHGLVTGATYLPEYQLIVLSGYDFDSNDYISFFHPFIFLLYDFQGNNFHSGNKRRLDFMTVEKAQIEAVATSNALDYYLTCEHFSTFMGGVVSIDIPAKLQLLDLREYLLPYLRKFGVTDNPVAVSDHHPADFRIYPNPAKDRLHIDFPDNFLGAEYTILNLNGQRVAEGVLKDRLISFGNRDMPAGEYVLMIHKNKIVKAFPFIKQGN